MTILNFGVNDIPYGWNSSNGKKNSGSTKTTGDVAGWLESKYGVMEFFWNNHQTEIVNAMDGAIQGSFESIMMGGPAPNHLFESASSEVDKLFQLFLDAKEMDNKVFGVPTLASLKGVSHRFKKKLNNSGPRPSFIDTGLYQSSFHFWCDDV